MKKKVVKNKVEIVELPVPLKNRESSLNKWEQLIKGLEAIEDKASKKCGYCSFVWTENDSNMELRADTCKGCPLRIKKVCGYWGNEGGEYIHNHLHSRICRKLEELIEECSCLYDALEHDIEGYKKGGGK